MSDIQVNLVSDNNPEQFDPHAYTIVIKRSVLEGEPVFHGRVVELPDLEAFEPTYEEAYNFIIDGIRNSKAAFDEQGRQFPAPLPDETPEFSGRVTLRMPSWLHAQLNYYARAHQTSLNQYIVTLLSWAATAAPEWVAQNQVIASPTRTAGTVTFSNRPAGTIGGVGNQVVWSAGGLVDLMQFAAGGGSGGQGSTYHVIEAPRLPAFTRAPSAKSQLARSARRISR
jgi:predicted HicB family RNase H-like nuclease